MYRIFNYPGCKLKFAPKLNEIINRSNSEIYVEPFCGTASTLLSLRKDFNTKVINDFSIDVMRIIKSFRDGNYNMLKKMYADIEAEFGSIKDSKEAYYNFRNIYNERYYKTDKIEKGFFLYIASRAAINSLFRVGPNGFNQSYGHRGDTLTMNEHEFLFIKNKLLDTVLFCKDYAEIIDYYDDNNVLFFLDPPYVERDIQGSYKDEKLFDHDKFLDIVKNIKGDVVYTDIYSDYILDKLGAGWKYEILKEKKNVSPGRNQEHKYDYVEVVYYNF